MTKYRNGISHNGIPLWSVAVFRHTASISDLVRTNKLWQMYFVLNLTSCAWAPAGIFAGVGKGSAKRSVGKGVWGSAGSSPSGVWGRAPAQLARGSGGALWAPPVGFGAKPRPPEDLVHCRGLKIVFLVLFTTTSMHKLLDSSVAERPECQKQF